ncbi:uncharacterized protein LOC110347174 isoform X3 [Heterocephalus glaber]|uniref:Uncharacterized protein LOC110347174 isoform X3 n=1 Tax=Heterocephalus glaber TaxID=10181 RepID=A0AAX6SBH1_HETGA|nr:uncharacterized protein LOC110347174 isoform X3 [Heterocephalus glaber]
MEHTCPKRNEPCSPKCGVPSWTLIQTGSLKQLKRFLQRLVQQFPFMATEALPSHNALVKRIWQEQALKNMLNSTQKCCHCQEYRNSKPISGLVDITQDPDFNGIYDEDMNEDPTYDPNSPEEKAMTRSRQSENCLRLFMDEILNARTFTTKRINIFMFMEELNLTSPPLQLRMLWMILRFTLLLFLRWFVVSQLFFSYFLTRKSFYQYRHYAGVQRIVLSTH